VIPAEFTGGWIRTSISRGSAPPGEDMIVWWLQSASRHADLRMPLTPGGEVTSFAGTTVWTAPSLTWIPDLELVPSDFRDTGVVSWDGADLLEAGTSFTGVGYVERWRRLPDTAGPLLALRKSAGRLVRTGSLALTVVDERPAGGAFSAVAWRLTDHGWTVEHRWPDDASAPPPPTSADLSAGSSVVLDDGALWTVDEAPNLAVTSG
jgi:hypothetical protein